MSKICRYREKLEGFENWEDECELRKVDGMKRFTLFTIALWWNNRLKCVCARSWTLNRNAGGVTFVRDNFDFFSSPRSTVYRTHFCCSIINFMIYFNAPIASVCNANKNGFCSYLPWQWGSKVACYKHMQWCFNIGLVNNEYKIFMHEIKDESNFKMKHIWTKCVCVHSSFLTNWIELNSTEINESKEESCG